MRPWLSDAQYRYINSPAFLRSPEWALVRQDAIRLNDGRCERCKRAFGPGVPLKVTEPSCSRAQWMEAAFRTTASIR